MLEFPRMFPTPLRGIGRPWAHASAPKRTLHSLPNAAPSGFPQALPEGEVLARLHRSPQNHDTAGGQD